jgi:hypothetical protein
MPNNSATKAALGPAAQCFGALAVGAVIWFGLLHYSKRSPEEIAAANAERSRQGFASFSPIGTAEASTQTYGQQQMQNTPQIPATVDPVALEMAVLQSNMDDMRRSLLQARIEADSMAIRSREISQPTPAAPTVVYIQAPTPAPVIQYVPAAQPVTYIDPNRYEDTWCQFYQGAPTVACTRDRYTGQFIR